MKFWEIVFLMLLLGGDRGLVPAPLGAFPQALGCDGRVNLLLAPMFPVQYFGNTGLFAGLLVNLLARVAALTKQVYYFLLKKL